jgi:hypothetical protein
VILSLHQPERKEKEKNQKSKQKPSACFVLRGIFLFLREGTFPVTSFSFFGTGFRGSDERSNQQISPFLLLLLL